MSLNSGAKQVLDFFRVTRFQAWPVRALPVPWRQERPVRPEAVSPTVAPVVVPKPVVPALVREPAEAVRDTVVRIRRKPSFAAWVWVAGVSVGLMLIAWFEIRTSVIQSWLFTTLSSSLTYDVRPGAATVIVFPRGGPVDVERGYPQIPEFAHRLGIKHFRLVEQARFSKTLALVARFGFTPPYAERPAVGLVIRGADDRIVYDATPRDRVFADVRELPAVIERSLLFIEDRELGMTSESYRNPAVDWDRLAKAALQYTGTRLGMRGRTEGGSTLAVQMEKYRHSESGRTEDPIEKLRQMGSASLRAYHSGPDTRETRRRIVLDYLNTVPLAAAPGHGEVRGFKEGLRVWFGRDPAVVVKALARHDASSAKARAFKQCLALLCAVRAPTHYLMRDHHALEARVNGYSHLLAAGGIIDPELAAEVRATPLKFAVRNEEPPPVRFSERKAIDLTRRQLSRLLGTNDFYVLDRLDLDVETTIDPDLQKDVEDLLANLQDPEFVESHNLKGERLLPTGDPRGVVYSFALFEKTPQGDMVRVHADNLNRPFDVNHGMKMELGSTAKLRTLAHYLEVIGLLHDELAPLSRDSLLRVARHAQDPLTLWTATTMLEQPKIGIDSLLEASLERKYSANPGEMFWTGGGIHYFGNFDKEDNGKIYSLREATAHSTNLVFIRLMRDLVRYHTARLPYDVPTVMANPGDATRQRLLTEAADGEARIYLSRAWRKYRGLPPEMIPAEFLGRNANSVKHLAVLFFGWNPGADSAALHAWLAPRVPKVEGKTVGVLTRKYANPQFTLADYAYLLDRHPLEVWCAGEMMRDPELTWKQAVQRSADARKVSMAWLMQSKNKGAQDTRLRERIEKDAFARMEPSWKKLGFPFERLVPSYATAIGSSADRPDALATLMGIIVDDGVKRQPQLLEKLRFGPGTPYHTVFEAREDRRERVLPAAVTRALRSVLAGVVDHGTAARVRKAFADSLGNPIVVVGGKTGSGDNRIKSVDRTGGLISSKATSRTAAFTFYIGDRYYGVITASVMGPKAENYSFTSALPLEVMKLAAPSLLERIVPPAPKVEAVAKLEPPASIAPAREPSPGAEAKAKAEPEAKTKTVAPEPEGKGTIGPARKTEEVFGPAPKPAAPSSAKSGAGKSEAKPEARPEFRDGKKAATEKGSSLKATKKAAPAEPLPPPTPKIKRLQRQDHTAPAADSTRKKAPPVDLGETAAM